MLESRQGAFLGAFTIIRIALVFGREQHFYEVLILFPSGLFAQAQSEVTRVRGDEVIGFLDSVKPVSAPFPLPRFSRHPRPNGISIDVPQKAVPGAYPSC